MDCYITEDRKTYVKHYLIDFGSTLGSAAKYPMPPNKGHENAIDPHELFKNIVTLGLYVHPYEKLEKYKYSSIGLYESSIFHPQNFKPHLPNPAFENMTNLDGYWGAKMPEEWGRPDVYGWPDYYVLEEQGRVVACAGLWDRGRDMRDRWRHKTGGEEEKVLATADVLDFGFEPGREEQADSPEPDRANPHPSGAAGPGNRATGRREQAAGLQDRPGPHGLSLRGRSTASPTAHAAGRRISPRRRQPRKRGRKLNRTSRNGGDHAPPSRPRSPDRADQARLGLIPRRPRNPLDCAKRMKVSRPG